MKFLLKMILLSGAMLANGMAMEDPLQNETAVAKNYREAVQEAKTHETDDDRLVLLSRLERGHVLAIYLQHDGKVRNIADPILAERIHNIFESYYKGVMKKYRIKY